MSRASVSPTKRPPSLLIRGMPSRSLRYHLSASRYFFEPLHNFIRRCFYGTWRSFCKSGGSGGHVPGFMAAPHPLPPLPLIVYKTENPVSNQISLEQSINWFLWRVNFSHQIHAPRISVNYFLLFYGRFRIYKYIQYET